MPISPQIRMRSSSVRKISTSDHLKSARRLNAISRDMLNELSAKVVEADKDPDIRCIVLTGSSRGFCAGLDLIDTSGRIEDDKATKNREKQLTGQLADYLIFGTLP